MLKGAPTLAVPLNVPLPTLRTVKLFVMLVPLNTVPYDMLPGVSWITPDPLVALELFAQIPFVQEATKV
jgi:hypothetical protein